MTTYRINKSESREQFISESTELQFALMEMAKGGDMLVKLEPVEGWYSKKQRGALHVWCKQ